MVGGVIAMTRDNGETFKTGITPEGINAEMLIGKMIVGETLTFENESGTVKFDKDGLYVNSKNFHLVSNDGEEDYFDKLKREMSENAKQQTDRMLEEYKKKFHKLFLKLLTLETLLIMQQIFFKQLLLMELSQMLKNV